MARRGHSAGGTPLGHVPPEFAELFAGAKDHELVPRLHSWLARKYGSAFADLFWLVELAAKGDRESVRLDAIVRLQTIFYGEAPQTLLVEQKETNGASAPIRAPSLHHIGKVFDVLRTVGALPSAGEASRTRGSADAEVEQVPPADAGPARMG
jgi:hypothetical protein